MQQQYSIVPKATMQRYPIYLKALRKLHSQNVSRVLSSELSELVNIAATTIRRDLSFIGCLGKQGYGYDVEKLIQVFNEKLGTGFDEKIILIGVGNLGHALLNYNRWNYVVGEIVMAFEIDEDLIGEVKGIPVYHIDQLEEKIPKDCRIAILTASTDIQDVVDRLYNCGVLGLIDFTHQHISVPKGMILKEIDIVSNIQELVFETNTLKKFK
ncbi:MAG: redox-sensing transcriptional repressor Rex [Erysipelotrichaceae bacterium]|jgi:redox-sensing transcriptional repressor|nr:redox-sensing transcriptional repressor Rex [Erysipelotrichaceae bacterium]